MKNSFLLSALFVFVSASLYSQILLPWFTNARTKYERIEELRSVFAQGQDLQTKRDALRAELNSVSSEQQDLIRGAIPVHSPGSVALFLLELNQLVQERSGLPLDTEYNVGAAFESAEEEVVILPISFNFEQISYTVLRQFLSNIQRWGKGVRIRSLQIGTPVDEDSVERGFVQSSVALEALFSRAPNTP